MINVVWIYDLMGRLFTLNQETITQNYRDYIRTGLNCKAHLLEGERFSFERGQAGVSGKGFLAPLPGMGREIDNYGN